MMELGELEQRFLPASLYPMNSHHMREIESYFPLRSHNGGARLSEEMANTTVVFICFTNRVGSNYLTDILDQVGFGVRVSEEDFNSSSVLAFSKRNKIESFDEYLANLVAITKKNDTVFWKIGSAQLLWLANRGLISDFFPKAKYIFLRRRDKIAQAISLYVMNATGRYLAVMPHAPGEDALSFDKEKIAQELLWILDSERNFQYFFTLHGIEPKEIWYEEFIASPRQCIFAVAKFCNLTNREWINFASIGSTKARVTRQSSRLKDVLHDRMRVAFSLAVPAEPQ